jgi:hypothetical protein
MKILMEVGHLQEKGTVGDSIKIYLRNTGLRM